MHIHLNRFLTVCVKTDRPFKVLEMIAINTWEEILSFFSGEYLSKNIILAAIRN